MSKATLKKELELMDRPQLVEIILDLYSNRPEAKEYFEFFLNPDIAKLRDKVIVKAQKELARTKRGSYSRMRISKIKALDRYFASFNPGCDEVLDMKFRLFNLCVLQSYHVYYTPQINKSITLLLTDMIKFADTAGMFTSLMTKLRTYLTNPFQADAGLKRMIRDTLTDVGIDMQVNPKNTRND